MIVVAIVFYSLIVNIVEQIYEEFVNYGLRIMNYLVFLRIVYKMKGFRTGKNLCRNVMLLLLLLLLLLTSSRLLTLGIAQTRLALRSLNRSLAFVA